MQQFSGWLGVQRFKVFEDVRVLICSDQLSILLKNHIVQNPELFEWKSDTLQMEFRNLNFNSCPTLAALHQFQKRGQCLP